MCGIVGIVSKKEFSSSEALDLLKRLDYRGYDSWGIATNSGLLEKEKGGIGAIKPNSYTSAILHTRWATHGGVTKENAHPHADCSGNIFIVHNGIIENYLEMKQKLKGHKFLSETDSEVIAHYLEEKMKTTTIHNAVMDFMNEAKGTFAVVAMIKDSSTLYAFKRDSPLVLGLLQGKNIVASDIYAFSDKTSRGIFFEDDEFAEIDDDGYVFYSKLGNEIEKFVHEIHWKEEASENNFEHYMLKEIHDIPDACMRLIQSLQSSQKNRIEKFSGEMRKHRVIFTASGSSYHASLLGVNFLRKAGLDAQAIIASEFREFASVDDQTLVIAISQSGETMDVIDALKHAKSEGAKIAGIVNVPYSSIQRISSFHIETLAGQEISVAATKSFVNQALLLLMLAKECGYKCDENEIIESVKGVLSSADRIKKIASSLRDNKDIYVIGRGICYPVAREIALKLKEVAYIHAEGMMGGELKHGTLALIEQGTPVISLLNGNTDIISNTMEVKAREARIIAVTSADTEIANEKIMVRASNDASFAVSAAVVGQLLTYYIALEKKLPIDKPRNLAKSVTVK